MTDGDTITRTFGELLTQAGFRARSGTWYRSVPIGLLVMDLQESEWGNQYYVNIGVFVKDLGHVKWPKTHQCHFYTRADSLDPGRDDHWKAVLDLESEMEDGARRRELARLLTTIAVPFLESLATKEGLRSVAVRGGLTRGLTLLTLKQYLGIG